MMFKKIHGVIWTLLFLMPQIPHGAQGSGKAVLEYVRGLEYADSLYSAGAFKPALQSYQKVIKVSPAKRDPSTLFRTAFAAYKSKDYALSAELFFKLSFEAQFLPEFSTYFYLKSIWQRDPALAARLSEEYIAKYRRHSFADSLILPTAEYFFNKRDYKKAERYFRLAKRMNIDKNKEALFLIRGAEALSLAGDKKNARDRFRQIIKKYKSKADVLALVNRLRSEQPQFIQDNFFAVVKVYLAQRKYATSRRLLEDYIKEHPGGPKVEKARFLLTKIYYQRGRYQSALYGFKNLLKNSKDKNMEAQLRIYIARTYRKLGLKKRAVEWYLDYAERFPRRRLAAEAVWKSAWLAEEMNDFNKALELYHLVYSRWPRSSFAKEAYFREGFTWFRFGKYEKADTIFRDIRSKKWEDVEVNRGRYWSALCLDAIGDTAAAKTLRIKLANNLWDDYYTMRSYLWVKEHADSLSESGGAAYPGGNPLLSYGSGVGRLLTKIEQAFQLRLLLGEGYGKAALSDIKFSLKNREEWIALAEIYKKFGDYGKAYEIYDRINRRYFAGISYKEKAFMLKERFPYYYDSATERYSRRYGVEKELILAVIKQESKYKSNAESWANAHGLMQLVPATAREMASLTGRKLRSVDQLYDPDFNIRLGARYLKRLQHQFKGRKERMLAAYNAGPHRVKRWQKKIGANLSDVFIENIEFAETRDYVRKVMKNYWAYKVLDGALETNNIALSGLFD